MEDPEDDTFAFVPEEDTAIWENRTGTMRVIASPSAIYFRGSWANADSEEVRATPALLRRVLDMHDSLQHSAPTPEAVTPDVPAYTVEAASPYQDDYEA